MRKPRREIVIKVLTWLEEMGLSVYGQCVDLETGEMQPGCRDYNLDEIDKLWKLIKYNQIYRDY